MRITCSGRVGRVTKGVYVSLVSESRMKEIAANDGSAHHALRQYTPVSIRPFLLQ